MGEAYTHSAWRVKPGLEDEFVRRWDRWSPVVKSVSRFVLLWTAA
jgi:hypothetical protein